ncbi:MAG: glycosyltransferase family 2 protein [Anaerolineales bacterium]
MTSLKCSIVVRAFNEEKHLGRLFTGLDQQSIRDFEVILVNSGSTDRTVEIATSDEWNFPVRVVQIEPERFSFGRSLNYGIRQASSEIIVIASAHIFPVYPDWLERLIQPFSDSQVGLSYGKQRGGAPTHFSEHQIFSRWHPEQPQIQATNPFCNNANAAIRRSLWNEHPYDETLTGLEDLEWAHWAIETDSVISYVAEAEIIHIHEASPNGIYNRYKREAMAFKRIFPEEKFGLWDFIRFFTRNVLSDFSQAWRQDTLIREIINIQWFRFMQFWGTYQGYRKSGPLTSELRQTFYYPDAKQAGQQSIRRDVKPIRYHE